MTWFTNAEYVEMHFMYALWDGNASAAQREYQYQNLDQSQCNRRVWFDTAVCGRHGIRTTSIYWPEQIQYVKCYPLADTFWVVYETGMFSECSLPDITWGAIVSFTCTIKRVQVSSSKNSNLHLQLCWWFLYKAVNGSDFCATYCGLLRQHSQRGE
jgi:hypothetical protein